MRASWRAPVHPRSRGEHVPRVKDGSSPLARGTPADGFERRPRPVHPRSGNTSPTVAADHDYGSSPLARGTRRSRPLLGHHRFIPARAGNTRAWAIWTIGAPVHPRSRGEHSCCRLEAPVGHGSSPLARGTLQMLCRSPAMRRFIPARAGNTDSCRVRRALSPVHPRSRGEHPVGLVLSQDVRGSSPLARGTRGLLRRLLAVERFIPARAHVNVADSPEALIGSSPLARGTRPHLRSSTITSVHPRSRGEHDGLVIGSVRADRFIPARAGNTRCGCAHPRSHGIIPARGEHLG